MSSLKYLNLESCRVGHPHRIWSDIRNPLDGRKASVKARILTQRYPIATSHTAGPRKSENCPLCQNAIETTEHFLLKCPESAAVRKEYISNILLATGNSLINPDSDLLLQLIIDPSLYNQSNQIQRTTRDLTFKLHNFRSLHVRGVSGYRALPVTTKKPRSTDHRLQVQRRL